MIPPTVGRCGVLICGYDALNRITNNLLKPEEGARVRISTRRWLAELSTRFYWFLKPIRTKKKWHTKCSTLER